MSIINPGLLRQETREKDKIKSIIQITSLSILGKLTMIQTPNQPETLYLELPSTITLKVTQEEFEALSLANRDLRLERTAEGELIVNPPTGGESGKRNFNITGQLARWYEEHEALGEAFDSSTGFILPNGANRSPDASWLRRERWQSLTPQQRRSFIPLCPDFVIELRSPSDSLSKLQGKISEYIANGTQLAWLIDPINNQVEIYRPHKEVERLDKPTQLSGEDVLTGFVLNLTRIWS